MKDLFDVLSDFLKSDLAKEIYIQILVFVFVYTIAVIAVTVFGVRFFMKVEKTKMRNKREKYKALKSEVKRLKRDNSVLERENAALQETVNGLTQEIHKWKSASNASALEDDPALAQYVRHD